MKNKALLIGIDTYPAGCELYGCVNDIHLLKEAIERNGDGSLNFDIKMLPNVASSSEAMQEIQELFKGDADMALFYFSGHGSSDAYKAELAFPDDVQGGHYSRGLAMDDVLDVVSRSPVRNKIIILDCCYAGYIGRDNKIANKASQIASGVSILSACREDESAQECGGHGLFTEQLCNALKGGAADYAGNITIGGVYAYIDRSFGQWQQRPTFKTNVTEFAPLKRVLPKVSSDVIRQLTHLFVQPDTNLHLDPSFEFTNSPGYQHELLEPYADINHVRQFKLLQQLQSIGFVEPVGEEFMYFAAMHSGSCRLTALGKYYWRLVNDQRI